MEVAEGHAEPMPKRSGILDVEDCLEAEPLFTLSGALPTGEGWYWHKPNPHYLLPYILHVMRRHLSKESLSMNDYEPALCVYHSTTREWLSVGELGGLWSQRIPEPKETGT